MSQKVSPILFNNTIYNNSKWYNKINNKFALNEDLQIREIINILFFCPIISKLIMKKLNIINIVKIKKGGFL